MSSTVGFAGHGIHALMALGDKMYRRPGKDLEACLSLPVLSSNSHLYSFAAARSRSEVVGALSYVLCDEATWS